jgi:hypothetical protein
MFGWVPYETVRGAMPVASCKGCGEKNKRIMASVARAKTGRKTKESPEPERNREEDAEKSPARARAPDGATLAGQGPHVPGDLHHLP